MSDDDESPKHMRLIRRLRRIARSYGARIKVPKHLYDRSGMYCVEKKMILVARDQSARDLTSAFFHELAHFLDHQAGFYKRFYAQNSPLYIQRRLALRAERHTDRLGKQLCKKYFPKIKYHRSYWKSVDVDFLKAYYRDQRSTEVL